MKTKFQQVMEEASRLIDLGHGSDAKTLLQDLPTKDIPRAELARFCRLAIRAGAFKKVGTLLHPLVRGTGRKGPNVTDEEKLEYALYLLRVGALGESHLLLNRLQLPESFLFQAFVQMAVWDYDTAAKSLQKFLSFEGLSEVQRKVGETNFLSCLVHERRHEEVHLIAPRLLKQENTPIQQGYLLRLLSENALYERDFAAAKKYLDEAEKLLQKSDFLNALLVRKWKAILSYYAQGKKSSAELKSAREEAIKLGHWESVRECDRYLAMAETNKDLFLKVYFGTPFTAYRKRMLKDAPEFLPIPSSFSLKPFRTGGEIIDSRNGEIWGHKKGLGMGRLTHRLFLTLCKDLYRPYSVASLHSELYPKVHFNPESSPGKIKFIKVCLQEWLTKKRLPIHVVSETGLVSLRMTGPVTVRLHAEFDSLERSSLLVARMKEKFEDRPFSTVDATKVLQISKRSVQNLLKDAKKTGTLAEVKEGKHRRYKFAA